MCDDLIIRLKLTKHAVSYSPRRSPDSDWNALNSSLTNDKVCVTNSLQLRDLLEYRSEEGVQGSGLIHRGAQHHGSSTRPCILAKLHSATKGCAGAEGRDSAAQLLQELAMQLRSVSSSTGCDCSGSCCRTWPVDPSKAPVGSKTMG